MGIKTKNKKIKPALDIPFAAASLCEATEDISANEIVYVVARSGATRTVALARANALATSMGTLLCAKHDTPSGSRGIFLPWCSSAANRNTAGTTIGDPVFVSGATAGGFVFAADAGTIIRRQIGKVGVVSATVGQIDFDLQGLSGIETGGTGVGVGTRVHTLTVTPLAPTSVAVRDAATILDAWTLITTGGSTENFVLTNDGDTVFSQATGTVSADGIVRAATLDGTYTGITAGDTLSANFDGGTIAGIVYVLTVPAV